MNNNRDRVAYDGGYIMKSLKNNNKLVFEHSTRGTGMIILRILSF